MTAKRSRAQIGGIALVAIAGWMARATPAQAHNKLVHQDMVDFAYQVMQLVAHDRAAKPLPAYLQPPPEVAPADWQAYLDSIVSSRARVDDLPTTLPPAHTEDCRSSNSSTFLPVNWAVHAKLGTAPQAVADDYLTGSGCGLRIGWKPGGVFNALQSSLTPRAGGLVLGLWASNVDEQENDTHLWVRATSVLGLGAAKSEASKVIKTALTVLAIPFICAWDCIFHSCSDCIKGAKDFADAANPIDKIDGWIPGFGDKNGGDLNTMWHFLNVQPGRSNDYDDMQGLLYEEAGWHGEPDPVDVALMAVFDATGLSLNYDKADGIHHYEIVGGNDGHADTSVRSKATWQFSTAAHTAFEPLDNLALYGWRHFRDDADHATHWLGFPLHALGDAAAPHHLIGSTGWGHRPYEDSVERQWWAVRYLTGGSDDGANSTEQELAQIRRILISGYAWRKQVLDWRAGQPARAHDVPVRDLVTQLGIATAADAETDGGWAYQRGASLLYNVNGDAATALYTSAAYVVHIRSTIERGVGAMLAFLVSVGEVP